MIVFGATRVRCFRSASNRDKVVSDVRIIKGKDAAFFEAFSSHAAKSVDAAKLLVEMMVRLQKDEPYPYCNPDPASPPRTFDEELKKLATRIKEAESAGDRITHETIKRLHENWITPLDRNDIHQLISRMDDVLDYIEAASERVVLFEVCVATGEAAELAQILERSCTALAKAIDLVGTMAKSPEILELCVEVNRLENAADAVHRKAIATLFKPGNDPLMVMKWRDIFDSLESATDRCEDVANILEGVVLEYA